MPKPPRKPENLPVNSRNGDGWLSEREQEALQLYANGLTPKQISVKMGIQYASVPRLLWLCRSALGARTSMHAVAIALRDRLIEAPPTEDEYASDETGSSYRRARCALCGLDCSPNYTDQTRSKTAQ